VDIATDLVAVSAMTADDDRVYIANKPHSIGGEEFPGSVRSAPLGGGRLVTVVDQPITAPYELAVDATQVYYTNEPGDVLRVVKEGGTPTVAAESFNPIFGRLIVDSGRIVWTEVDPVALDKLVMIASGGTPAVLLHPADDVPIDCIGNLGFSDYAIGGQDVYFVAESCGVLRKKPLAGGLATTIGSAVIGPRNLAATANHIYWPDALALDRYELKRIPIAGGIPETVASLGGSPAYVALDGDSMFYWLADGAEIHKLALESGVDSILAADQMDVRALARGGSRLFWIARQGAHDVLRACDL
jgi:hypothetical protein